MEFPINNATIQNFTVYDANKEGKAFMTKAGKPFKKVFITFDDVDIDGFDGRTSMLDFDGVTDSWQKGDKISGKLTKNGDYWNFEMPRVTLESRVKVLEEEMARVLSEIELKKQEPDPEEKAEQLDDDLPF